MSLRECEGKVFQLADRAVVKSKGGRKASRPKASEVAVRAVAPEAWEEALKIAGGDPGRLAVDPRHVDWLGRPSVIVR